MQRPHPRQACSNPCHRWDSPQASSLGGRRAHARRLVQAVRERPLANGPGYAVARTQGTASPPLHARQLFWHTPCARILRRSRVARLLVLRPMAGAVARCCGYLLFPSPLAGCPQVSHDAATLSPRSLHVKLSLRSEIANQISELQFCNTSKDAMLDDRPTTLCVRAVDLRRC